MSCSIASIDFETRSPVDLRKTGVYAYAENPDTSVWCAAWAIDDGPVNLWTPGHPCPPELVAHVEAGGVLAAWNANFEIALWTHVLTPRHGWPLPRLEQWQCSMAAALAQSLPGSLENAAGAVGLDIKKDMAGRRLMIQMSQPRRPRQGEPEGLYWWDDKERRQRLYAYNKQDVEVERAIRKRLVPLRPSEARLWHLDQRICSRGIYVDKTLALRAKAVVAHVTEKLDRAMAVATDWDVTACSNVNQLKTWVRAQGVEVDSLDKEHLAELLARHDLAPNVRRALELRLEAGKASVKKINALLDGTSGDGRACGLLQYHAASTGRWAGRRFQPQNIKRPENPKDVDDIIDILLAHPPAKAAVLIEILYGPPLSAIGDCLRGMVRAAPGNILLSADYSNIEGRVLAWLAGEAWKLDAFRRFDAGEGPDLYKVTAGDLLGKDPAEVTKEERQTLGKVPELASGYQGGHGAYIKMGATGETLSTIVEITRKSTSSVEWASAEARFDKRSELSVEEWTALRLVIDRWRAKHPAIKQYWRDLEDAAMRAVKNPGELVVVRDVQFKVAGSFLWLQLPSGRALCYPYPHTTMKEMPWVDDDERPVRKQVVAYKGQDSTTKQWVTQYVYGGKWAENIAQAVARDLLAEALPRLDAAGYEVILHTHDDATAEVPADFGSLHEFEALMVELPPWAAGLPVAADGWTGERYRKG